MLGRLALLARCVRHGYLFLTVGSLVRLAFFCVGHIIIAELAKYQKEREAQHLYTNLFLGDRRATSMH
jgi:hypothetical protein